MPPLLYIIFNRPEQTRITFDRIRALQPPVLYVAADAPRDGHQSDPERTAAARRVTENIDWPCDVRRLYAESNMGCGRRISSAITQVLCDFETVIILEDDCVAEPTFFSFCETLLDRYEDDERIMAVSGNNYQLGTSRTQNSYYFSKYPHCWGWSTWRRAWQHFDLDIQKWPAIRDSGKIEYFCETEREIDYWIAMFNYVECKQVDSWAFPWTLNCWLQNGLTILPDANLVSNIGFGTDGTHTTVKMPYSELPTYPMEAIVHPTEVFRHVEADRFTDDLLYSGPWDRSQKKRWFSRRRKRAA